MKLRNKKTREIVDLFEIVRLNDVSNEFYLRLTDNEGRTYKVGFNSLAKLNEEWEDYEEPKEYWRITDLGELKSIRLNQHHQNIEKCKEIGNYFDTREEAEKAVEKLKAWKRLKEAGFEFKKWKHKPLFSYHYDTVKQNDGYKIYIEAGSNKLADYMQDLDLLFGGENEK